MSMTRLWPLVCLLILAPVVAEEEKPSIRLVTLKGQTRVVASLSREALVAWEKLSDEKKAAVFALFVQRSGSRKGQPAVSGSYQVEHQNLHFLPEFSLTPGVRYMAVLDRAVLGSAGEKPLEVVLSLPRVERPATTVVAQVFPTSNRLPENLLKFYIHFSAPMAVGASYQYIRLLDESGKAVELPFLELDQELWNPDGTRLTLFFDPGRIKRGLKPREEVGPALVEGKKYTLAIDRTWKDAEGRPLKESFRKSFTVTAPDDTQPDIKTWKLTAPASGDSPLVVKFAEPMDHALAQRMLWVTDSRGNAIAGKVFIKDGELSWHFTPESKWLAGSYSLVADTRLEDRSGNSLGRPFEVDMLRPVEKKIPVKSLRVPFEVKSAAKGR